MSDAVSAEDSRVGDEVGCSEVTIDGNMVGSKVGAGDGAGDGLEVGDSDGSEVEGELEGSKDGVHVSEGAELGETLPLGAIVGDAVRVKLLQTHWRCVRTLSRSQTSHSKTRQQTGQSSL